MKQMILEDKACRELDEDAYDFISHYTKAFPLAEHKDTNRKEEGKIDMCHALNEIIADAKEYGWNEGKREGTLEIIRASLEAQLPETVIATICRCSPELIRQIKAEMA